MPISTIGSNSLNQTSDLTINGQTVGKGGGNVATNTAHGVSALAANTTGLGNTSVGYQALDVSTSSDYHTAVGWNALGANTTGARNTAFGAASLATNSTGGYNVAMGVNAGYAITTGSNNVALGYDSLSSNTTASNNTAVGYQAGYAVTTGTPNCFFGYQAGNTITTATYNNFFGYQAGQGASGNEKNGFGSGALQVATGSGNNAFGSYAGSAITSGTYNACFGHAAGAAVTTGGKNTIIGSYSGNQGSLDIRTSSNFIVLSDGDGNPRMVYEGDNNVWSAPQIYNSTTGSGANVHVGTTGRLYRSTSSLKYKTNVQAATFGLADVLKLRAVTYQGNGLDDGSKTYAGLIAEEVHDAGLTEFVQYAEDGTPDALAYGNMVSLLVKSIQELKTIVDAQAAEIAELKAKVA
jgi:hypothetical protein